MATANEKLADAGIAHAIDITRYGSGTARRMIALMNRVDADLFAQIRAALERLPPESFTVQRLDQMLVSVQQLNASLYRSIGEELDSELLALAGYEGSFQHQLISSVLPAQVAAALPVRAVTAEAVYAAAMARPFQGKLLSEALAGIEAARAGRIRDALRIGYVEGETIDQMVRRLRGTRAQKYADGLLETDRRGTEALVRTAINHVSNYSRQALYEANPDLIQEWEFLATLDGRTTLTCAGLSGQTFKVGTGPQPPRHWGCRSTSVPVLRSAWAALGLSKSEIDPGTQASMDGQVSADLSYGDWLRTKPAALQDEVLGPERGKLFRDGKVSIDRFTDRSGKVYTLDELRQRDADMFKRSDMMAA